MSLTTVIYTVCDACSKSEDFMAAKGDCRKIAKAAGWATLRVDGKLHDICPSCVSDHAGLNHIRKLIRGLKTADQLAVQEAAVYGGQNIHDVPAERLLNP